MTGVGAGSSSQRLGRYHLAEPLGGGPTGEVFRAKVYGVAGFERQYAIKRFHRDLVADPTAAAAIAAAARSYGGLEHPRIARLHEYGVAGGATFTATELVDGIDLSRMASLSESGEPLIIGGAAWLWSQIARAVGFAHGQGIGHFGLCPTNLIATQDGDIVITDFGFLPPRLPARPGDDKTLAARIPYLAPEQLVGESTSSATDVFQLGVIGYELLTGTPPFHGATGFETAQQILAGRVQDPPLPKPLTKVVMRCLARSPFERFPDARALADAIDAAVRQTPLPGGRRDVASAVTAARARADEMARTQSSGAVSFPLPAPPKSSAAAKLPAFRVGEDSMGMTVPWRDDHAQHQGNELEEELPTRIRTARELRGEDRTPRAPAASPPPVPPPRDSTQDDPDVLMVLEDLSIPATGARVPSDATKPMPAMLAQTLKGFAAAQPEPLRAETAAPPQRAELPLTAAPSLDESLPAFAAAADARDSRPPLTAPDSGPAAAPDLAGAMPLTDQDLAGAAARGGRRGALPETLMDIPASSVYERSLEELVAEGDASTMAVRKTGAPIKIVLALLTVACVGAGGYLAYQQFGTASSTKAPTTAARPIAGAETDAAVVVPRPGTQADEDAAVGDGTAAVANSLDAGSLAARPADAGGEGAGVEVGTPTGDESSGMLEIKSIPSGARVYVDGTKHGKTPATVEVAGDEYVIAVILPGHKVFRTERKGLGWIEARLEEVSPPDGPAGIKVRCKEKNRYYVMLDGNETGQLCPTERLGVALGAHVIEVYDPVTDSRKEFRVDVKETRNSVRVKID